MERKDTFQNNPVLAGFTVLESLCPVPQAFFMRALPLKQRIIYLNNGQGIETFKM